MSEEEVLVKDVLFDKAEVLVGFLFVLANEIFITVNGFNSGVCVKMNVVKASVIFKASPYPLTYYRIDL